MDAEPGVGTAGAPGRLAREHDYGEIGTAASGDWRRDRAWKRHTHGPARGSSQVAKLARDQQAEPDDETDRWLPRGVHVVRRAG